VQGDVEHALARILRLSPGPRLSVAGRTDAGVHAVGQVAHADLHPTDPSQLCRRLNALLALDVRIYVATLAPAGFDARFSALSRRYRYRLSDAAYGVDPLQRHNTVGAGRLLDVEAMAAAALGLLGEHDFAAYCRRRAGATTVRRVLRLDVSRDAGDPSRISVLAEADAFCHSMVRALIGALLAVGQGRRPPDWPAAVLASAQRDPGVRVAPAHGLTLEAIHYPPDAELAARAGLTRRVRSSPERPAVDWPSCGG
jgi:tRNA pseudouridine38-40 synthase